MTSPAEVTQRDNLPYSIWEFNYKPECYIHPSWLSNLPDAELLQKLISEDDGHKSTRLSHYLMTQLGFNGQFYFDFKDPITQLALWHGEDLKELIYHIGILFFFDDIRSKITRDEVNQYRCELGLELYDFALNRAPKLKRTQLKHAKFPQSMSIRKKVLMAGLLSLFTAIKGYPAPLLKRFVIKLPRKWFDAYLSFSRHNKVAGGRIGNISIVELMMNEITLQHPLDISTKNDQQAKNK